MREEARGGRGRTNERIVVRRCSATPLGHCSSPASLDPAGQVSFRSFSGEPLYPPATGAATIGPIPTRQRNPAPLGYDEHLALPPRCLGPTSSDPSLTRHVLEVGRRGVGPGPAGVPVTDEFQPGARVVELTRISQADDCRCFLCRDTVVLAGRRVRRRRIAS